MIEALIKFVTDNAKDLFDYLVAIQLHPAVSGIILIVWMFASQRWEVPLIDKAKLYAADAAISLPERSEAIIAMQRDYENRAHVVADRILWAVWGLSIVSELALYWPKAWQTRFICVIMSIAQVGLAGITLKYIDKWGLVDYLGNFIKKKAEV